MREFDNNGCRVRVVAPRVTANWLRTEVQPDVAVTLTLLQSRNVDCDGMTVPVGGDAHEYEWAYGKIIHSLSAQHFGRAYRRHGKLIANFVTLEGDGEVKRKHLHAGLRCPKHVERSEFIGSIYYHCALAPWVMADVLALPITDDWTGYTLKEGSEALLVGHLSF